VNENVKIIDISMPIHSDMTVFKNNNEKRPTIEVVREFGAQALPSVAETISINGSDAWPPDWNKLAYHDFQYDQTFYVAKIDRGNNWKTFVHNSQDYQAKLLKLAIESFRRSRFEKVGSFFQFMFMDCWPSITWSVVSYERIPKKGFYAVQQANQPVLVGTVLGRDSWSCKFQKGGGDTAMTVSPWVINDLHQTFSNCEFTASMKAADGSRTELLNTQQFTLEPDMQKNLKPFKFKHVDAYEPGVYQLELCVVSQDNVPLKRNVLSLNTYDITIDE